MKITSTLVKQLISCDQSIHNWTRILGRVGYTLVTPTPDHSHANVAWNAATNQLLSRRFSNDERSFYITFNVEKNHFAIYSSGNDLLYKVSTEGIPYKQVIINLQAALNGLGFLEVDVQKELAFRFPDRFEMDGVALALNSTALKLWKNIRTGADYSLRELLNAFNQNSEIRIWATNFDTGIFCDYGNGIHQYAGLACADESVCEVPYFYNSFYKNESSIVPKGFTDLQHGVWKLEEWKGAVLAIDNFETSEEFLAASKTFLVQSTHEFLNQ